MTVGELRRALEGVSDTREVCFWYDEEYLIADRAGSIPVVNSSGYGNYSRASDATASSKLVFALDLE